MIMFVCSFDQQEEIVIEQVLYIVYTDVIPYDHEKGL